MSKYGRLYVKFTVISIIGVTVFVLIAMIVDVSKTPEERAQALRESASRIAAENEAERQRDSMARLELLDKLGSEAYLVAKSFVASKLKYPNEADFPWTANYTYHLGNGVYDLRGTVDAKNAFGVISEHAWRVVLQYRSGDQLDSNNWDLLIVNVE